MPARTKGSAAYRKQTRKRAKFEKLILLIRIIFLGLLDLIGVFSWRLYTAWKERVWSLDSRITVVVAEEEPTIYSYDPQSASLVVVKVPKDTQVDACCGYGNWLVGSLWGLGVQERKEGLVLKNSIQKALGIPVDAWIELEGEVLFKERSFGTLSAALEATKLGKVRSDLTFFDRLNLLLAVSKVGEFSRVELDLVKKGVITKSKLSDGIDGYVVVSERTTLGLEALRDDKVFSEAKTLKVTNSSGKSGLGASASRVASVLGLRVITADTSKEKYGGRCKVRGKKADTETLGAARIAAIFGCAVEVGVPSGPANLELILGEELSKDY